MNRRRAGFGTMLTLALAALAIGLVMLVVGDIGGRGSRTSLETAGASARALSAAQDAIDEVCEKPAVCDRLMQRISDTLPSYIEPARRPGAMIVLLDDRSADHWDLPEDATPAPGLLLDPVRPGQLDFLDIKVVAEKPAETERALKEPPIRSFSDVVLRPLYYQMHAVGDASSTGAGHLLAEVQVNFRPAGGGIRLLTLRQERPFRLTAPDGDTEKWQLQVDDPVVHEVIDD